MHGMQEVGGSIPPSSTTGSPFGVPIVFRAGTPPSHGGDQGVSPAKDASHQCDVAHPTGQHLVLHYPKEQRC